MSDEEILPEATFALEKFIELEANESETLRATVDLQPSETFTQLCTEGPDETYTGGYLIADQLLDLADALLDDYCEELIARIGEKKPLNEEQTEAYRIAITYYFKRGLAVACVDRAIEAELAATRLFLSEEERDSEDLVGELELFMDSVSQVNQSANTIGSQYVSEVLTSVLDEKNDDME